MDRRRTLRGRLHKLFKEEKGQSLVEFALVLPLLLLFTIGTILVTISFMQKSRMNALAYTSARTAAVRGSSFDSNTFTLDQYKTRSGQRWLSQVTPSAVDNGAWIGSQMTKPAERFDLLVNLVSGNPSQRLRELKVRMRLPREYTGSTPERTQTFSEVDYRYTLDMSSKLGLKIKALEVLVPDALFDTSQMADDPTGAGTDLTQRDDKVSLDPPNNQLKDFYDDLNWKAYRLHDEEPTGTLRTQQVIGEKFALLEAGGTLFQLGQALGGLPLLNGLKNVIGPVAQKIESETSTLTRQIDADLKESFAP